MLVHVALSAAEGRALIRDWTEARALWDFLAGVRGLRAAALMPTHLHALIPEDAAAGIQVAARRYALWRNHQRGEHGPVWRHRQAPTAVRDHRHARRTIRYIHLNPCRDGLAKDPLAWPFSTHRDAVGLAWPPLRRPERDPHAFHRFVSSDPSVDPAGTELPVSPSPDQLARASIPELRAAVSALTRTPATALQLRGPARSLLIRVCRVLTEIPTASIAYALGVHPTTVLRSSARKGGLDPVLPLVARVLGDPRFQLLAHNVT